MSRFAIAMALLVLGCAPNVPEGRFACTDDSQCPDGWSCVSNLCFREASGIDGGPRPDAGLDGGADGGAPDAEPPDGGFSDAGLCGALTLCGDDCVDTATSADHCGACDNACDALSPCRAGACRPTIEGRIHFGGAGFDGASEIAFDPAGNAYVGGSFSETFTFGGITFTSAGGTDGFVASFAPEGTLRWAVPVGGPADDLIRSVAWDATLEQVVAVGMVDGTATAGTFSLTTAGSRDAVVLALDSAGTVRWARTIGGPESDEGKHVAVSEGNAYVVMDYRAEFTAAGNTVTHGGDFDALLLQLESLNGATLAFDRVSSAGVDIYDGVIADGAFACAAGFYGGPVTVDGITLTHRGELDAIVRCVDFGASTAFSIDFGSAGNDLLGGVALQGDTIAFVGVLGGGANVGPVALPAPDGNWDMVVGTVDRTTEAITQVRQFRTPGAFDYATNVTFDSSGQILWTGRVQGPMSAPVTLPHAGESDLFIAALAPDLEVRWARAYGGAGDDGFQGVAEAPSGEIWAVGDFIGAVDFGGSTLTGAGSDDAVIVRFQP